MGYKMTEVIETQGFESGSSIEGRRDELARGIHEALKVRRALAVPQEGEGNTAENGGGRMDRARCLENWDDEYAFVHSEEPEDVAWNFDDSLDAGKSTSPGAAETLAGKDLKPFCRADLPDADESLVQPLSGLEPADAASKPASSSAEEFVPPEQGGPNHSNTGDDALAGFLALRKSGWEDDESETEHRELHPDQWEFDAFEDDWSHSAYLEGADGESAYDEDDYEPLLNLGDFVDVPLDAFEAARDEEELNWSKSHWISHDEYVREVALEIARAVGWREAGMQVIAWAIRPYQAFGRVRADLTGFIREEGVTVRELRLVTELRTAWLDGGFRRGWVFIRNRIGTRAVDCKINLDWWLALKLYRVLGADDVEEVRLFLDHCFEAWTETSANLADVDLCLMDPASAEKRAAMHFHGYLHLLLDRMADCSEDRRMPPFFDSKLFPNEEGIRDCETDGLDPIEELLRHA